MVHINFDFQKFNSTHFKEYKNWFDTPDMKRYLGHIDQEWLDYVQNQPGQLEFAIFWKEELVGEIGIGLPTKSDPCNVITNIAVNPRFRGQRIGQQILAQIVCFPHRELASFWLSYVEKNNLPAQKIFLQAGWSAIKQDLNSNDMICFKYES